MVFFAVKAKSDFACLARNLIRSMQYEGYVSYEDADFSGLGRLFDVVVG